MYSSHSFYVMVPGAVHLVVWGGRYGRRVEETRQEGHPNEGDAKALQKEVMRLSLNGVDVMGHIEQARKRQQPAPSKLGPLRDALPAYIDARSKPETCACRRPRGTRATSSAEVKKLIDTSRKVLPRWTVFLELAVATGARWGELVALHKSDLDLERQRITISKTVSDGKVIAETKTSKSRRIPISDVMTKTLVAHLRALEAKGKKWSPAARELVFPTMRGHVLSYSNWNMLWKPLMAKPGMTYRPFHALRHTCASAMLEAGVDIRYVQHIMGHASIQMTSDIYGHLRPEAHVNGANKVMDSFINGKR